MSDLAAELRDALAPPATACPDCGARWPLDEFSCPGCLLSVADLAAAAELYEAIAAAGGPRLQPRLAGGAEPHGARPTPPLPGRTLPR